MSVQASQIHHNDYAFPYFVLLFIVGIRTPVNGG